MSPRRLSVCLASGLAALLVACACPAASSAAHPADENDPCSAAGRDSCGTTGVGLYATYRYGIRWFGDYRGLVPGQAHTFCIDLNFWYPSPRDRYLPAASAPLVNRDGVALSAQHEQELAYAVWADGRSDDPDEQAAVMLYVHSRMGDARPGEVDPSVLNPTVVARYAAISADAARYHGPYRIVSTLPAQVAYGTPARATLRVLAASGLAVPGVRLALAASGARGVPSSLETDASGSAQVAFVPDAAGSVELHASAAALPSTLPDLYVPSVGAARSDGQRIVVPATQSVSATAQTTVLTARVGIESLAAPATLLAGGPARDTVTITRAAAGWHATVAVSVYGPFPSVGAISCGGAPVWQSSLAVSGSGSFATRSLRLQRPGWYAYREVVPAAPGSLGNATDCTDPSERIKVEVQPALASAVSAATLAPGGSLSDAITVSGLDGQPVDVEAELYGPFATAGAIGCHGSPIWIGTVASRGTSPVSTTPFPLTVAGYYAYSEQIPAGTFTLPATGSCRGASETAIVQARPQVTTRVSAQAVHPGASLSDSVVVTGLGSLQATVTVALYGPFASRSGLSCAGQPAWSGSLLARGNGTYQTAAVTVERVGYYVYHETLAPSPAYPAVVSACAQSPETTVAEATPTLTTVAAAQVVRPGSGVADLVDLSGLGRTKARVAVALYGPFASRAALRCDSTPVWQDVLTAPGDGVLRTPSVRLARVGFYLFHERLLGSALIHGATTPCLTVPETTLAAPQIITGGGDLPPQALVPPPGSAPTRLEIPALGIAAPVSASVLDLATGTLGVPTDIHRTGWWVDGAAPGASTGAVLIAGHVDSAVAGTGALFSLVDARPGTAVTVTTASGRSYGYRVVSVVRVLKRDLPLDVFSRTGPPRLVVVTCGGPFDEATRHYVDNVIVTAVPT